MSEDELQKIEEIYKEAETELDTLELKQKSIIQKFKQKSEASKIKKIREKLI